MADYPEKVRENPLRPCNTHVMSNTSYAVWSPGDGTAIAAAESGTFFHIADGKVRSEKVPVHVDFYDVHGFARDDIWAVGTFGAIWHYDGRHWQAVPNPTNGMKDPTWFEAVWGRGPNDVYVAGDECVLLHYDGNGWSYILDGQRDRAWPNRLYSIAGLDDGTTYVVGSRGGLLRIQRGQAELMDSTTDAHFCAIARIPGTDHLLACGGNGTVLRIDGDDIHPEATDIVKPRDTFYALDAAGPDEIVVVGWGGNTLCYDGRSWTRNYTGRNSFLEGIAKSGPGQYVSAGWMGRVMSFDFKQRQWKTLQTGRAERVSALAVTATGAGLAGADTGSLLHGNSGQDLGLSFAPPVDIHVVVETGSERFLLTGGAGYVASAEFAPDGALALNELPRQYGWTGYCSSPFAGGAFIGGRQKRVFRAQGDELQEVEGFPGLAGDVADDKERITQIAHFSDNLFAVRVGISGKKSTYCRLVNVDAKTSVEMDIKTNDLLFGGWGRVFIVSKGKVYLVDPCAPKTKWTALQTLGRHLRTAGEKPSCGAVSAAGDVIVGGTHGSVIVIRPDGHVVSCHCGAYRSVTAVAVSGDKAWVGLSGGGVTIIDLPSNTIEVTSISAPTYHAEASTPSGVLMCGDQGTIGIFPPGADEVSLRQLQEPRDLLTALAVNHDTTLLGGTETLVVVREGQPDNVIHLKDLVITSLSFAEEQLYLGTSSGKVFSAPMPSVIVGTLKRKDLVSVTKKLAAPVIDLAILQQGVRVALNVGKIYALGATPTETHTLGGTLRRGALPQHREDSIFAGKLSHGTTNGRRVGKVCRLGAQGRWDDIPFFAKKSIRDVSLHGPDDEVGYWAGGWSGTLLLLVEDLWYQVSTGIGNQLFGLCTTDGRLTVCGAYGAVRYDDIQFVRDYVSQDKTMMLSAAAMPRLDPGPLPHIDRDVYGFPGEDEDSV
jgi:hypothetical protein